MIRAYISKKFFIDMDTSTICYSDKKKKILECDKIDVDELYRFIELYAEFLEREKEEEEEEKEELEELASEAMEEE
jgi:hypothetical protein